MGQVKTNRRDFLGALAASSALVALYGPGALAQAAVEGDASVAARVLEAATLAPFNDLTARDWAAFAEERLRSADAATRTAFSELNENAPDLVDLTPQEAANRLARALLPGYKGPQSATRAALASQMQLDLEAMRATSFADVPSATGKFLVRMPSDAERRKYMTPTQIQQLHASTVAARALSAANALAARPEQASKNGLGVQL